MNVTDPDWGEATGEASAGTGDASSPPSSSWAMRLSENAGATVSPTITATIRAERRRNEERWSNVSMPDPLEW